MNSNLVKRLEKMARMLEQAQKELSDIKVELQLLQEHKNANRKHMQALQAQNWHDKAEFGHYEQSKRVKRPVNRMHVKPEVESARDRNLAYNQFSAYQSRKGGRGFR